MKRFPPSLLVAGLISLAGHPVAAQMLTGTTTMAAPGATYNLNGYGGWAYYGNNSTTPITSAGNVDQFSEIASVQSTNFNSQYPLTYNNGTQSNTTNGGGLFCGSYYSAGYNGITSVLRASIETYTFYVSSYGNSINFGAFLTDPDGNTVDGSQFFLNKDFTFDPSAEPNVGGGFLTLRVTGGVAGDTLNFSAFPVQDIKGDTYGGLAGLNAVGVSVPEPSTYACGFLGVLGLGLFQWHRRATGVRACVLPSRS